MNEPSSNGSAPPQTIVDPEFVVPYLTSQLQALNAQVADLRYENALHRGYIDQLKKQIADLEMQQLEASVAAPAPVEDGAEH